MNNLVHNFANILTISFCHQVSSIFVNVYDDMTYQCGGSEGHTMGRHV